MCVVCIFLHAICVGFFVSQFVGRWILEMNPSPGQPLRGEWTPPPGSVESHLHHLVGSPRKAHSVCLELHAPSETRASIIRAGFQAAGHKSLDGYSEVSRPEMGLNGGSGSWDPGQAWESAFPPAPR